MIQINVKGPDFSDGNCAQIPFPDLFYPENKGEERDGAQMIERYCTPCKRRQDCLQFALDHNEEEGIWGGLTPAQRKELVGNAKRPDLRRKTFEEVQRLLDAGLTVENACREVGILPESFRTTFLRNRAKAQKSETNNPKGN